MKTWSTLTFVAVLAVASAVPAAGAELAGVTLADTADVADHTLHLNGLGLRKKAIIKVYVAGLYLPEKETDPAAILAADTPRRTVLHFLFGVGASKMCDAWDDGLEANTPGASAEVQSQFKTLCTFMDDLEKGDRMVVTYVPEAGTNISVKGEDKGTIPGKAFADALFACWIGPKPPSSSFKEGLLGG